MTRPFRRVASAVLAVKGWGASPIARALNWLQWHELRSGGIRVHSGHSAAYSEVTGYLIPTLLDYGRDEQALRLARWLMGMQQPDGSFLDPDFGKPYVFDTGQVLRGLLRVCNRIPEAEKACRLTSDYLCNQMIEEGVGGFGERYQKYNGVITESIHLYVLPPLMEAAEVLQESRYQVCARRCYEYYNAQPYAFSPNTLTHFLAYELDAAIEMGLTEAARSCLTVLQEQQTSEGRVSAVPRVDWVCVPALAQLAICWYKTGQLEAADRAMACMDGLQRTSGGFLGSDGVGGSYFPCMELSWAVKFYLDGCRLRKERNGICVL